MKYSQLMISTDQGITSTAGMWVALLIHARVSYPPSIYARSRCYLEDNERKIEIHDSIFLLSVALQVVLLVTATADSTRLYVVGGSVY